MSSERSDTRKKCSQNFDMTMWFVAEKLKQRGPNRNLYADWIILFKEQFLFRITGFLDFVHRAEFKILENNVLETGSVSILG
jgi:hypothetical protein